jgi:hypothetical protein
VTRAGFAKVEISTSIIGAELMGRRGYLSPADAFPEGGYEVDWARAMGHPETLQDDIRALVLGALAG